MKKDENTRPESERTEHRGYEPPRIQELDQKDVLKTLQITSAGATWWVS